jgi:outer membrane protein assembly factor BamB
MEAEPTRRELLSGLAVAAGAAATAGTPGTARAQATLGRWPMFGYDLGNTGHNPDAAGVPADPGPAWGFEADSVETNNAVTASPAVADGRVYVGSEDNRVYALGRSDGTEEWVVETGGPVRSTPAVENDRVYVGSDDGTVYAVDAETGEPAWTFDADGRVRGSPAVADGRVHVGTGGGTVHAIDSNGEEVWAFEEPEEAIDTAPAIATGDGSGLRVFAGSQDGRVYAIDGISGNREWLFETESRNPINGSPAVAGGRVYVGGGIDQQVYALGADSGEVVWRVDTGGSTVTSPAVVDGRVYAASRAGGASTLHALEGGEEVWTFEGDLELTAPAVADGRVYVASRAGTVYAVDTGGEEVWSFEADTGIQAAPAVAGDRLYLGSDAGIVYALTEGGDAAIGGDPGDSPTGPPGGPPGGDGGGVFGSSDLGFLLFPLSVVAFVATIAGGLYAAHRVGLLARVEAAADSVDTLFAPPPEGDETEDGTADERTEVWDLVVADVIDRAEQTDRTATQDLLVTKYVDSDTLESPVVAYDIESYRDDPARIRIVEPRFESDDRDDARPLGDGWELDDDSLVFEATLDPGEQHRTIVGRPDCPDDALADLLDRPEVTVETV